MLKGSEKAWTGAKYAAENSGDLLSAARAMANDEKFGLANALAILSAEESAKSVALIFESIGFEKTAQPLKAYFRSHKVKHEAGILYATLARLALHVRDVVFTIEREHPECREQWPTLLVNRLVEDLHKYDQSDANPFEEMRAWADSADISKQNGLYVELIGNEWRRPCDVTRSEYETRVIVAENLAFCVGKAFEYLNHADIKKAYNENQLKNGDA